MTKVIAILIVIAVLFVGWQMFVYWDKVSHEEETHRQETAAAAAQLQNLPGLPQYLEASLATAKSQGDRAFGVWLKNYGHLVLDPRKAVIELDYCQLLMRNNPAEARRIFATVKDRTAPSSPVWPRVKEMEKSFQ
ncbi:MAG: hypothetical protein EPO07_20405 [Verrucomicrobia bacterium]|nr:MAG: hypothetical protein EPO07_20405 [Verrucomicrobiota bacterium]